MHSTPLSEEHQLRTEALRKIIAGETFSSQKKCMDELHKVASNNAVNKKDNRTIQIIGAGPTGQMQALLAYKQGLKVVLTEAREDFSRTQIFQIDRENFDATIKPYLSQDTFDYLIQEGALKTERIALQKGNASENVEKEIVLVTIRDLESILYGVSKAQEALSDGVINVSLNNKFDFSGIENSTPSDVIIIASGGGKGRESIIESLKPYGFDGKSIDWSNSPKGVAVQLNYDPNTTNQRTVEKIRAALSSKYTDHSQFNFLHLEKQGRLQINIALSSTQYKTWKKISPRNTDDDSINWNNWEQKNKADDALLTDILTIHGEEEHSIKNDLKSLDAEPNVWVNESAISRLDKPAASITPDIENQHKIPVIFVGDAQANNWFLFGDGNPREHEMINIITNHLLTAKPDNEQKLNQVINEINEDSVKAVLLDNTKIPGQYRPGLKRSDSLPTISRFISSAEHGMRSHSASMHPNLSDCKIS